MITSQLHKQKYGSNSLKQRTMDDSSYADERLGICATLWQSSFMMVRLMDAFITESDLRNIAIQNEMLNFVQSGKLKEVENPNEWILKSKEYALKTTDLLHDLNGICENTKELHLKNINKHCYVNWFTIHEPDTIELEPEPVKDYMHSFELCVFGYIRQEIERVLEWNIPNGVKQLCFLFHGNFLMDSCILKPDNVTCIGHILLSKLRKNGLKLTKLFDTNCNGFDESILKNECGEISKMSLGHSHSIGIIRTNYNHVFVSYSMNDWRENEDLYKNKHIISFLFDKAWESTSRLLDNRIYVFSEDFDCSLFEQMKMSQIFAKHSRRSMLGADIGKSNFPGSEQIQYFDKLHKCIKIVQFEMFEVCRE